MPQSVRCSSMQTENKSITPSEKACVNTTPQMSRFRDAKVCNNLVTDEIDDHRIQSGYKCIIGLQNPEGKNSTFGIASAW